MGFKCQKCEQHTEGQNANKVTTIARKVKYDKMGSYVDRETKRRESFCIDSSTGIETAKEIMVCKDCLNLFDEEYNPEYTDRVKFVRFKFKKKRPVQPKKKKRREE
jgi:hypothetical protein